MDPEDEEYPETIKNAVKKLEGPMDAAMPCRMGTENAYRRCGKPLARVTTPTKSRRQSIRASWRPMNPREIVWNLLY